MNTDDNSHMHVTSAVLQTPSLYPIPQIRFAVSGPVTAAHYTVPSYYILRSLSNYHQLHEGQSFLRS